MVELFLFAKSTFLLLTKRMSSAEKQHDCLYSVLLDLPYFDPVRMLLIDHMHNLFMEKAKHIIFSVLIGQGILNTVALDMIKKRLKKAELQAGLGCRPALINTGTFLTAEHWKNWTILQYIVYKGLISSDQMECWRHIF